MSRRARPVAGSNEADLYSRQQLRFRVRGLTLWQPMAWAISHGTKRVENRPWRPWSGVTHIVIHAGQGWSDEHADMIRILVGDVPERDDPDMPHGALVAVARIVEDTETINAAKARVGQAGARWWSGPHGWILDDVIRLVPAIPYRAGRQGLFELDDEVFRELERRGALKGLLG